MVSENARNSAWYYIQENADGNIVTQKDAAFKFNITEVTTRKAIKEIKDDLGIKGQLEFLQSETNEKE